MSTPAIAKIQKDLESKVAIVLFKVLFTELPTMEHLQSVLTDENNNENCTYGV